MAELAQTIRGWADGRCEYCRMPESSSSLPHVIDHVIARQHGGATELENCALSCGRCNQFKGPNIAGIDPESGQLTRLYHPRKDQWSVHFRYEGPVLVGRTILGRATVRVLAINLPIRVAARQALIDSGEPF